jgi:hypothetical protein
MLTDEQCAAFERDGIVVLRDFLSVEDDITPLTTEIGRIIGLVAERFGFALPDGDAFDRGFLSLSEAYPEARSAVYDSIKHLITFRALAYHPKFQALFRKLRNTDLVGSAGVANGIRIDTPGANKHALPWHQDFTFQLRSFDSVTFWAPLIPCPAERGPVEFLLGSHRSGPLPLEESPEVDDDIRRGVYGAARIVGIDQLVDKYERIAPASQPGDLIFFDSLMIHRSGFNSSSRPRWSSQLRYFNYADSFGRSIGWSGSVKSNRTVHDVNQFLKSISQVENNR